ncbi:hypothetical protein QJS10_CPB18g02003 [Acorus calamus]|uniref:Uncharacterized protein n=1 Tax=Acorus calamus TaxID=4465 RepID=A0AAV9CQN1_ACOCL|nr:hypothetical protein QJS10_CPB18g02003 [Acorus calamus]
MSSSTTSRRIKDRGGAGGKVMAPKLHQPQRTPKDKGGGSGEGAPAKRTPLGKENPKTLSSSRFPSSSSRPRFSVQPIPRVDKSLAAAAGDGAVRWSTSSMPLRGKPASSSDSQPPVSDIAQILSGLRLSRASSGLESKPVNGLRVLERCQQKTRLSQPNEKPVNGSRAVDDLKERSLLKQMVENESNGVIGSKSARKDAVLYVNSRKPVEKLTRSAGSAELPKSKSFITSNPKAADEKVLNGVDSCKGSVITDCSVPNTSKGSGGEAPNGFCVYEKSNEDELNKEEKKDVQVGNRYPSRLREKLALLEGKVQRIASDIKATKDMLDLNNSDVSKKILLDIQSKISGIEKAIDHVVDKTPFETGLSQEVKNDDFQVKDVVGTRAGQVGSLKTMMKNQNHEELEARLFPHHRLLRNRSSSTALGGDDHSCDMGKLTSDQHSEMEAGSLSPIEENPIALEFLASLNSESCKTNKIDRHDQLDFSGINYTQPGSSSNVSSQCVSMKSVNENVENYAELRSDEKLEDFDDQENKPMTVLHEESEDSLMDPLCDIGCKTSTAGWFASEGEAVLLAHNDGSCTYYDIVNMEKKAEYMPPVGISNIWGDCWLIRAAGSDGCSGKYVVAASAGNT